MKNEMLDYLSTRRSALAMTMREPAPDAEQIRTMIMLASRVPDHGKLVPWRFVEYRKAAREDLATLFKTVSDRHDNEERKESREKEIERFRHAPLVIGVISRAQPHWKVPEWEQVMSAGAATMQLLIAANAIGFEAQWLSGWFATHPQTVPLFGLQGEEKIAGLVHIGTSDAEKTDRTRPEFSEIFSVYSEVCHTDVL